MARERRKVSEMAIRFRKSIKLFPGVKVNLNKNSTSVTFGGKGIHRTYSSTGRTTTSAGIPGTGLYVTETTGGKKKNIPQQKEYPRAIQILGKLSFIFVMTVVIVSIIKFIGSLGTAEQEIMQPHTTAEILNVDQEAMRTYTNADILNMEGHPVVFDRIENVEAFYRDVDRDKVKILDVTHYSIEKQKLKSRFDDNTIVYLIKDPSNDGYLGTVRINLYTRDLCKNMTAQAAADLVSSYLPDNYLEYYNVDASYQYSVDGTDVFTHAVRLNDAGIEYHNNEKQQYPYYYNFKIFHYTENDLWAIETDYAAFGNKDKGWIDNYSVAWDVEISE